MHKKIFCCVTFFLLTGFFKAPLFAGLPENAASAPHEAAATVLAKQKLDDAEAVSHTAQKCLRDVQARLLHNTFELEMAKAKGESVIAEEGRQQSLMAELETSATKAEAAFQAYLRAKIAYGVLTAEPLEAPPCGFYTLR